MGMSRPSNTGRMKVIISNQHSPGNPRLCGDATFKRQMNGFHDNCNRKPQMKETVHGSGVIVQGSGT